MEPVAKQFMIFFQNQKLTVIISPPFNPFVLDIE